MDPLSVLIILASVILGAFVVLVFRSNQNKQSATANFGSGVTLQKSSKSQKTTSSNNTPSCSTLKSPVNGKQVHFADVISTTSNDSGTPNGHVITSGASGQNNSLVSQTKPSKELSTPKQNLAKGGKKNRVIEKSSQSETIGNQSVNDSERGSQEPSPDEIDSSILPSVFNQAKAKKLTISSNNNKSVQQTKKPPRKRQSSERSADYSAEQLFTIIAASNLSKDEVELAIEALLTKLESGDADWQQPKNDPIQRLKNQLRDVEVLLSTERQNHEQTRAHLAELKTNSQSDRVAKNAALDEVSTLRHDLNVVRLALDRTTGDMAKQRQLREEAAQLASKHEQENAHLKQLLAGTQVQDEEFIKLRGELDERMAKLRSYEMSNQSLSNRVQELDNSLRTAELQIEQLRSNRQHDDYEACAKISELESDRSILEKALKDHVARLKEVTETNDLLEKSLNESRLISNQQEDQLKRAREEQLMNESSMKQTLFEMEHELRKLQEKLTTSTASSDERLRREIDQFERELNDAGQREQKLTIKMRQLREGLSELFPDLRPSDISADDWVVHYLVALKQLTQTVNDLRRANNNNIEKTNVSNDSLLESPSKRSVVDKSTLTLDTSCTSSRIGSPTSNGRSSRASGSNDHSRKQMETKLVELSNHVTQLEDIIKGQESELEDKKAEMASVKASCEQQVKSLCLQRSKLEAQMRFGLDSFKMEQERAQRLEEELRKLATSQVSHC